MITYVDTSTLLKLLVDEDGSERAALIWDTAQNVASSALITVEARAALASAARGGRLTQRQHATVKRELALLLGDLHMVAVTAELIAEAGDLAESEGLRGYDAVHLASALKLQVTVLTSADAALCDAAERNGLHIANPLAA